MSTLLIKSQMRFAWRHPVAATAALAGVTLAVTAVVAVHVVGTSLRANLEAASTASSGGYTHVATRANLAETDYFELRRRWRHGELPSVEAVVPVIDDYVRIAGAARRLVGFDPLAGPGIDAAEPTANGAYGEFLTDDVLFADSETAAAIAAAGLVAERPVRVIEASDDTVLPADLLADLPTAQRLLRREGKLDAIWMRVASARTWWLEILDALLPGIEAALPSYADPAIDGYQVTARRRWNPLARFTDASIFNLGILALLSLLMAAFLVVQASYANAARRRWEQDRLLALGVSPRRLQVLAVAEGCALGSLGAALGIAVGVAVARALLHATDAAGPAASIDAWVVGKAFFCGVLVAAVGPLFAFRIRCRTRRRRRRWPLALLALAVTALAWAEGLPAAFGTLLAACFAQVAMVVPMLGAGLRAVAARLSRRLATCASWRAAAITSGEARLALGALSVAAAAAVGMGLMVDSLRRDFTAMLEQRLWQGVYLGSRDDTPPLFDLDWIRGLPGVREVRRYGDFEARLVQGLVAVTVAELDAAEAARYGYPSALTQRGLLNEVGARLLGLQAGDSVVVRAGGASATVRIAHVFRDFGAQGARLILPMAHAAAFDAVLDWRRVSVRASAADAERLANALGARYGVEHVRDQAAVRRFATTVFDRSFVVSQALTAVALAVAAIGLYAALTALQAGREREFRLLSAVGLSRAQIWRQAMVQTTMLGLVASLAALPLGLFIAWVLCAFVNPHAFGWSIDLQPSARAIGLPLLSGIGAALLAGAIPAYRSSFRAGAVDAD